MFVAGRELSSMRQDMPRYDDTCHALARLSGPAGICFADASTDIRRMATPHKERRKHLRRPVLLNCHIEGTTVAGPLQITDLSESGCFIATSHPLTPDSQVTLLATLAGDRIRIIGRVVRVQPGRGAGIEINLSLLRQYDRLALEDYLRQMAPKRPYSTLAAAFACENGNEVKR